MKRKERLFYSITILCLIGIIGHHIFVRSPEYINIYKEQIKQLDQKIDSLHVQNKTLESEVDSLNTQISVLDKEINKQDQALEKLEKEKNEKIITVDSFTNSELTRFFTDRYKHLLSSDSLR